MSGAAAKDANVLSRLAYCSSKHTTQQTRSVNNMLVCYAAESSHASKILLLTRSALLLMYSSSPQRPTLHQEPAPTGNKTSHYMLFHTVPALYLHTDAAQT